MPYTAVTALSSLPVAGAKMVLSVHTWLTKHKEGPQYRPTSSSCLFHFSLFHIFHCVCTENAIFAPTTGRLDTSIKAQYCISGEKLSLLKYYINMVLYSCKQVAKLPVSSSGRLVNHCLPKVRCWKPALL